MVCRGGSFHVEDAVSDVADVVFLKVFYKGGNRDIYRHI